MGRDAVSHGCRGGVGLARVDPQVTAPAGDNVFRVTQGITSGNFNTYFTANGHGSTVYDSNCVSLQRSVRQNGDTVTVGFNAPSAGTYFIAIEFDARKLIGEPPPSRGDSHYAVHYEFTTKDVPHSTSELDLVED